MNQVNPPKAAPALGLAAASLAACAGSLALGLSVASRQMPGISSFRSGLFEAGTHGAISYSQFTGLLVAVLALVSAAGFAWMALSYLALAAIGRGHRGALLSIARRLATPAVRRTLAGSMLATSMAAVPVAAVPFGAAPAFADDGEPAAVPAVELSTAELPLDVGWGSPDLDAVLPEPSVSSEASDAGDSSDSGTVAPEPGDSQPGDLEPDASGPRDSVVPDSGDSSPSSSQSSSSNASSSATPAAGLSSQPRKDTPQPATAPKAQHSPVPVRSSQTSAHESGPAKPAEAGGSVVVEAGDTLWAIVARHLPEGSDAAAIATALDVWIEANPELVNPDLLHPGQSLTIPKEDRQ